MGVFPPAHICVVNLKLHLEFARIGILTCLKTGLDGRLALVTPLNILKLYRYMIN